MQTLPLILIRPVRTLHRLKESPVWLVPFMTLAAISVILLLLTAERNIQSTLAHLPASATDQDREAVAAALRQDGAAQAAFLPFRLLIGWSTFALLLHWGARAFGSPGGHRFKHILSLEIHGEAAQTAGAIVGAAGVALPSLSALCGPESDFLNRSLLASVNLCTLWYVVILTAGIVVLCQQSKLKAFLIVAGSWGIVQALSLGVLNLIRHTFHFLL